jgi:hypothetical protein
VAVRLKRSILWTQHSTEEDKAFRVIKNKSNKDTNDNGRINFLFKFINMLGQVHFLTEK